MELGLFWELSNKFPLEKTKNCFILTEKPIQIVFPVGSEYIPISMEDDYNRILILGNDLKQINNYGSDCNPIYEYETTHILIGWDCALFEALVNFKGNELRVNSISEKSEKIKKDYNLTCDKVLWKAEIKHTLILKNCTDVCCPC